MNGFEKPKRHFEDIREALHRLKGITEPVNFTVDGDLGTYTLTPREDIFGLTIQLRRHKPDPSMKRIPQ